MLLKMLCESGRASRSKVCFGVSGSTAASLMVQKKPSLAVTWAFWRDSSTHFICKVLRANDLGG